MNLPALVWDDLQGRPRAPVPPVRPGTSWCSAWDLQAAREWEVPLREWAGWALRCDATSMMSWRDPGPGVRLAAQRARRLLSRRRGTLGSAPTTR